MIDAFAAASGRPVPYRIVPRRAGDIATCYARPDKAARLGTIGVCPQFTGR
jgi:UDP-glucose 4-epimerase